MKSRAGNARELTTSRKNLLPLLKNMTRCGTTKKEHVQARISCQYYMAYISEFANFGQCAYRMLKTHRQRRLLHGLCMFLSLTCLFKLAGAIEGNSFEAGLRSALKLKPERPSVRSGDEGDTGLVFDSRVRRSVDSDEKPDAKNIGYPDPMELKENWEYSGGKDYGGYGSGGEDYGGGEGYGGYGSGEYYGSSMDNAGDSFSQMVKEFYKGPVCALIDVRNTPRDLRDLENCTVVNGFVQILFMPYTKESDFDKYTFPNLRMITEYLLVYRVSGLRSLRKIFPNLSVIRGRQIFYSYGLVLYENPQLQEIGLENLRHIERGGVRIQKNMKLCYLDTVNWKRLGMVGDKVINEAVGKPMIKTNGLSGDEICLDQCGDEDECRSPGDDREYCWGHKLCQQPACPEECPNSCENGKCICHEQCLGGCTAPNSEFDCRACLNMYNEGECVEKCPNGSYLESNWRCITKQECEDITWIPHEDGRCLFQCPPHYVENRGDGFVKCEPCGQTCRQDCTEPEYTVRDMQSFKALYGCTVIPGKLIIELSGGDDLLQEMEKALSGVEVVGSLAIRTSLSLVSLHFFKNLKRITGEEKALFDDTYSLYVLDNQNLRELFPTTNSTNSNGSSLRIDGGKAFFHFNRKLCPKEIEKFSALTKAKEDEKDISKITNGDRATCDMLPLKLSAIEHMPMGNSPFTAVRVKWENVEVDDPRTLIGYQVFYKESKFQNATRFDGLCSCGRSSASWVIKDTISPILVGPVDDEHSLRHVVLHNLKPYTQYALYVRTYTISPAQKGALSNITYFMTEPSKPSAPTDVAATALSAAEIRVQWKPPLEPNGNISHYIVRWRSLPEDLDLVRDVDMCKRGKAAFRARPSSTEPPSTKSTEALFPKPTKSTNKDGEECCSCNSEKILPSHEREAENDVNFEDYLHKNIFKTHYITDYSESGYGDRKRRSLSSELIVRQRRGVNVTAGANSTTDFNAMWPQFADGYGYTPAMEDSNSGDYSFQPKEFEVTTVNETNVTLTNLSHYTEYTIEVYACNHAYMKLSEHLSIYPEHDVHGCSIYSLTSSRTQRMRSSDNIPRDSFRLTTQEVDGGRVQPALAWEAPSDPNGYVSSYEIDVQQKRPDDTYKASDQYLCYSLANFERNSGVYTIPTHLAAGPYRARIRAVTLAGNGDWTTFLTLKIPEGVREHQQRKNQPMWIIAIIAVVVLALLPVALCMYKKKKKTTEGRNAMMYSSANPEYVSLAANYTPDGYEVDEDDVELIKLIGQGNFGKVFVGFAKKVIKGEERTQVAIKKLHEKSEIHKRIEFLVEAKLMKAFNSTHVVRLLGVVSQAADPMVIMEYMAKGDLKSHLRSRREDIEDSEGRLPPPVLHERLEMAAEIADGMAYLAEMKFVHRDLAARNCLVSADGIVKIGDFGLTRDVYETDYYRKDSRGLLPIRWMAPESLRDGLFDCRSDVWSYGVVLWEIATLAEQPYQGKQPDEVTRYVIDGGYMEKPKNCPKKLYDLMLNCWEFNPDMRPKFLEVLASISSDVTERFKRESHYFEQMRAKRNQHPKVIKDRIPEEESSLLSVDPFISREGSFMLATPTNLTPSRSRSQTPCGCHTPASRNSNGSSKIGCDFLPHCDHMKCMDLSSFSAVKPTVKLGCLKYSNSLNSSIPRRSCGLLQKSGSFTYRGPRNPSPCPRTTPPGTLSRPGEECYYSVSTETSGIERDFDDISSEESVYTHDGAKEPMLGKHFEKQQTVTAGQKDVRYASLPSRQDKMDAESGHDLGKPYRLSRHQSCHHCNHESQALGCHNIPFPQDFTS